MSKICDRSPALPRDRTESVLLGFTGDPCEGCGQLTLKVTKNHLYAFFSCEWCGHRYGGEPILPMSSGQIGQISLAKAKGYVGQACEQCGNFTLVVENDLLKCDTCGETFTRPETPLAQARFDDILASRR